MINIYLFSFQKTGGVGEACESQLKLLVQGFISRWRPRFIVVVFFRPFFIFHDVGNVGPIRDVWGSCGRTSGVGKATIGALCLGHEVPG